MAPLMTRHLRALAHILDLTNVGPGPSADMCRGFFCVVYMLEDSAEDFPGGFFWALCPTKMKNKNPATKHLRNKSGGSNIKIAQKKSVLPKTDPKHW